MPSAPSERMKDGRLEGQQLFKTQEQKSTKLCIYWDSDGVRCSSRDRIFRASKSPGGLFFFNRPLNAHNGFHYLVTDLLKFPLILDSAQSSLIWLCVHKKAWNLIMFVKGF